MDSSSLADLGFQKEVIFESILSTYDINGMPNAAPMGVISPDLKTVFTKVYKDTLTCRSMLVKKCGVLNITSDPTLYYKTVFKDRVGEERLPYDWFEDADIVNAPRLKACDAYVEVSVDSVVDDSEERARFRCSPVKILVRRTLQPTVYCRAGFALIESVIHATRIEAFLAQGRKDDARRLIDLVHHYHSLIHRIASDSQYSVMIDDLTRRLDIWRSKYEA